MTHETTDHAAEAVKHITWAHEQQSEEGQYEFSVRDNALLAQAEATLSLAEQQRIANEANAEGMRQMFDQLTAVTAVAREGWEAHNRVSALYEEAMRGQVDGHQ